MMLFTFIVLSVGFLAAQNQRVTGSVIAEEDGLPVVGASILVKGTNLGTLSDVNGNFVLPNVPSTAKSLIITYVGMKSTTVEIKSVLRVVLEADVSLLEEVIVVGYGTGKKVGTLIGSVARVGSEKIATKTSANAMDALQGQVSGLQVYTSSGEPGSVSSTYLRGVGSLTAGNEPLYVLDGMPVSSSVMVSMNSNDFESVTVLKDASATSIYGSRAANGVIYITSKRGTMGEKATVTVSGNYGEARLARKVGSPMNANELLGYQLKNSIITQKQFDDYSASGINTDWQKYFFDKSAATYQGNVAIQGGGHKTRYYVSGSYYFQDGVTPRSEYERFTFRSNIESTVNEYMKFGANLAGTYDRTQSSLYTYQGSNNLQGGIFGTMLNPPYYNPYDERGKRVDRIPGLGRWSPYYLSDKQPARSNQAQINGTVFVEFTPVKGLTVRSQFGLEAYDYRQTSKMLSSHPSASKGGNAFEGFRRNTMMTITNTAEYKFDIDKNSFSILAGHEGINNDYDRFGSQSEGHNDDRLTLISAGTTPTLLGSGNFDLSRYRYLSFFGRADYSYNNRYFADFSIRNDGSSRFGKDNRRATFISGGFMWDMKQEGFMRNVRFIKSLRIKGSVGTTGNSSIGNYDHLALVGSSNYDQQGGWNVATPGNKKLGWEKQILANVGFDVNFLDRYSIEFTYYHRKTKDMLMRVPLPYTSGFGTILENIGEMTNSGIEFSFNVDLYKDRDWYVGVSANYAYNKNKITKLFYDNTEWPMPSSKVIYKIGAPVQYYMPVFAGVDPADGKQMWKIPGTKEVTKDSNLARSGALDQATGHTRYAPHTGGFSVNASWKGIAINADFSYVTGKYIVNNDRYFSVNPAGFKGHNQSKEVLKEWTEPGDKTNIPKFGEQLIFDTHLLEDASFLRLKNLGVSYQLPDKWLRPTKVIKGFKVTFNARNLLTATRYKGADPEVNSNLTYGAYPNTKQFTFGAEITF